VSVWSLNSLSNTRSLPPRVSAACCDVKRSEEENRDNAPLLALPYPTCYWVSEDSWTTLFALPIASPLGVPTGPVIITEQLNVLHSQNYINAGTVEST